MTPIFDDDVADLRGNAMADDVPLDEYPAGASNPTGWPSHTTPPLKH